MSSQSPSITPISYSDLMLANPALRGANVTLKCHFPSIAPSSIVPYYMELLQRNWYIIKDVPAVYAFGEFLNDDKKQLKGGTGWLVQLALDTNKTVYVYDIQSKTWYQPFCYRWNEKSE